ncbi:type III-B CRISPR-associated protein Cas10/Cmr2 [Hyperthermus butylicus]|uniref:Hydrolase of HD superfamily n=1 Tax=Hyperthermus butylicus (strain DSM 5456 / JCM 9403 / PLM1-5) TaxID=415426 RepID=A2BKQ8_HYPBU|nr:type III-B CRISPR-associated protein Cas10/Cmr2 [Hyperthermus butylicus]ABM80569.1 hydrolase of HD superfamily [Hyperthermus butylicus DSM 5456]
MSRLHMVKLAALLHDPAWKPWIVASAFPGKTGTVGRVLAKVAGKSAPAGELVKVEECEELMKKMKTYTIEADAHQLDAAAAAVAILDGLRDAPIIEKLILDEKGVVAEADKLAASLDRWVLTYKHREARDVKVDVGDVAYANPLDPRFKMPESMRSIDAGVVCRYVMKLKQLYGDARELPYPLLYNLFYLLLEPLWYEVCRACIPLADTRTPTHTVFDHVYATAAMVNWLYPGGGKPGGFLVKVDVAGIQGFISASRKTRDLWAGSWLVSALAWFTVSEAVMLLGGDIVLSPYNPANPFFMATVLEELRLAGSEYSGLVRFVEDKVERAYLWKGAANQPVIPGTIFLALPCIDEDDYERLRLEAEKLKTVSDDVFKLLEALRSCDGEKLRKYFIGRFWEGWRKVWCAAIESARVGRGCNIEKFAETIVDLGVTDLSPEAVREYLEASRNNPPMQLRIVVINIEDEYDRLLGWLREKKGKLSSLRVEEAAQKLLFTWLFTRALPEAEEREYAKSVSIDAGFAIAESLEEATSKPLKPEFHECSMCGRLPAIVHLADAAKVREFAERLGVPVVLFSEGESLCPYCLVRRLVSTSDAIRRIMNGLNLYYSLNPRQLYTRPPSTDELAAMDKLLAIVDALSKDEQLAAELRSFFCKDDNGRNACEYRGKYVSEIVERYAYTKAGQKAKEILGLLEAIYDKLLGEFGEEFPHMLIAGILASEQRCASHLAKSVAKIREKREERVGSEVQEKAREVCSLLAKLYSRADGVAGRYYAIVRGDGDYFGSRIIKGVLDFKSSRDYVEEMLKAIRDEGARSRLAPVYSEIATLLVDLMEEMKPETPSSGCKKGCKALPKPATLVTPTYYMALSRGQMITALYDAEIVAMLGGFPVYAGGDDVAALAPGYISKGRLENLIKGYATRATHIKDSIRADTGFVPALIALYTRKNYWGLLWAGRGFHRTPIGAVYPAPVAYGRSYGIYIVHYRDPFMAAWRSAGDLEEYKDVIAFTSPHGTTVSKDATFLAYGRVSSIAGVELGAVALPNMKPGAGKEKVITWGAAGRKPEEPEPVGWTLALSLDLASKVEEEDRVISRSLYSDFERECPLAMRIARKIVLTGSTDLQRIAESLLEMIIRRNTPERHRRKIEYITKLLKEVAMVAPAPAKLLEALECGQLRVEEAEKRLNGFSKLACLAPLPWQIVLAAYTISSGRR